ncbi:MAG: helix-turn-helix transcriptional regulator [Burkholderiales bacterium]|nr:helix-turn-helix transcriptional regulator [Burkholderiales bacterium]
METNIAAATLAALAQPTRLEIFRALVVAGPAGLAAGALAEQLAATPSVLSFHLKELRFAGLVDSATQGRFVIYRARFDTMTALLGFLTENCCARSNPQDASCCVPDLARKAPPLKSC